MWLWSCCFKAKAGAVQGFLLLERDTALQKSVGEFCTGKYSGTSREEKSCFKKIYHYYFFFLFSQFFFFNLLIMKHESFLGSLFGKVPFPLLKSSRKTETLSLSITIWFTFQSDCPDILILIISCRHFSVQMTHFCYFWTFLSFLLYVYHRTPSPPWTRCSPMLPPWRS